MIIRAFAMTALLLAVSCDTDVNNRQQKILQRRPSDSSRPGIAPPPGGPIFRAPSGGASTKPSFSIQRPKGQAPFKASQPKVEYGFTPINAPQGQAQDPQPQPSAPVENRKPLIINVAPPPPKQQRQPNASAPVAVSYQSTNFGVVEGAFKEKPFFAENPFTNRDRQASTNQQQQKGVESQLSYGPFSFNQPVGAKINFESPDRPDSENTPYPSIQSSYISAGPPKVDKFPPKPSSGPNFPPRETSQSTLIHNFPKAPPSPPPSFNKNPPKPDLPAFQPKPIKENYGNFPPPPQFFDSGKRINGEHHIRIPFDQKKVVHSHPPPPPPIFRGPPPPKKIVHSNKPNPNFEIQKASVVGPFTAQQNRPQRPPPPPRPVASPPPQQSSAQAPKFEGQAFLRNPEFDNFPPADFGKERPIQQEAPRPAASQVSQPPAPQLPVPSAQFVQETNPHMFSSAFPVSQNQHQPQIPQQQALFNPAGQQPPQFATRPQFQHQGAQHQFQQQGPQHQFHQQGPQHQFQLQGGQPQFHQQGSQPQFQFQGGQPQFQLQGTQHQLQLPASFGSSDLSKLNPYLGNYPSSSGSGISQFGGLPQGGLSASGVASQFGLPSSYPQFNPNLAATAQLYKGILPAQQYPSAGASGFPFSSVGAVNNPFLSLNKAALQSILPLRSNVPSVLGTHSVPSSGVEGIPQFQPLPNSLNFPEEEDDDEQDIAASQSLKKFVAAPKTNSSKPKKTTLKDILAEDCTGAEDFGYCASPPRYPTQQIKTIMKQCKEEIEGLIQANEEEEHHVSKRETTPDQFTWATESCSSTAATVEPGYARDSKGHWLVVVQQASSKLHQRVDVDVCASEGGDCGCKQYFETMSLVAWDPDHPNDCPKMRSFKFPSKCECPTK